MAAYGYEQYGFTEIGPQEAQPAQNGFAPVTLPTGQVLTHSNIFVKGFPAWWTEETLRETFGAHGTIENCKFVIPPGKPFGYSFVKMTTLDAAASAINALNGMKPDSTSRLEVKLADYDPAQQAKTPCNVLYFRNLPADSTEESLMALVSQYGTVPEIKKMRQNDALVHCATVQDATNIMQQLNRFTLPGQQIPLNVNYADTPEERMRKMAKRTRTGEFVGGAPSAYSYGAPGGGYGGQEPAFQDPSGYYGAQAYGPQGYGGGPGYDPGFYGGPPAGPPPGPQGPMSVYVAGIPPTVENHKLWLYEQFAPFGGIAGIKVLEQGGKPRGVGFVNYTTYDAAVNAANALNTKKYGEKILLVNVQDKNMRKR